MLTVQRARPACGACRLHLSTLFEHGFTRSSSIVPRTRNLYSRSYLNSRISSQSQIRRFSSPTENENDKSKASGEEETEIDLKPSAEENIATAIQARKTFGDTLPKDYLTKEEYVIYERLYGPPLRETRGEDVIDLLEPSETEPKRKNVLMRADGFGGFEEVLVDGMNELEIEASVQEAQRELEELEELEGKEGEEQMLFNETEAERAELEDAELEAELEAEPEGADINTTEDGQDFLQVSSRNQREAEVLQRLKRDMEASMAKAAEEEDIDEEFEEEEEEDEYEEEELEEEEEYEDDNGYYADSRSHPNTIAGRFTTHPSTLTLPADQFVLPIIELLERTHPKHIKDAAERAFGGPGLPYSSATPGSKKHLPQKHIGLEAGQNKMSEVEADAYMAGVMPGVYSAIMSTLVETRKRLGRDWIRDMLSRPGSEGPRILDAGGAGAGIVAWREIFRAEWDLMRDEGLVHGDEAPLGKSTVLTGPDALRHRMSRFLNETTFLPRLPDYFHASSGEERLDGAPAQAGRKQFDVIIAPHTLFPLKEDYRRRNQVEILWSLLDPSGGVLILLEKGLSRGFEAIAGARSHLLSHKISSPNSEFIETDLNSPEGATESDTARFVEKEQGMIVAPCTNHTKCPMYTIPGLSPGRKDFCHFSQRFIRPPFLQRLLGAKGRNHEDVKFSYLVVRRGIDNRATSNILQGPEATDNAFEGYESTFEESPDAKQAGEWLSDKDGLVEKLQEQRAFNTLSLPRTILSPLKRRGHVTLDVCTPSGTLERWTVPKSFSRAAYHDARKASWGDLWALGAKTRVSRSVRLGKGGDGKKLTPEEAVKQGRLVKKGKGMKGQAKLSGKMKRKNVFELGVSEQEGLDEVRLVKGGRVDRGRRTKGGRVPRVEKKIGLDDF